MSKTEIPSASSNFPSLQSLDPLLSLLSLTRNGLKMMREYFYRGLGRSLGVLGAVQGRWWLKNATLTLEPPYFFFLFLTGSGRPDSSLRSSGRPKIPIPDFFWSTRFDQYYFSTLNTLNQTFNFPKHYIPN